MVTISEIRFIRSDVCLLLDTGEQFWIHRNDLSTSGFSEGKSYILKSFLDQICSLQYPRALNHAVYMLARRPCSKWEIRSRLKMRRYSDEVTDLVLLKLEKEKLIDDSAFCDQWIRFRSEQGYGLSLIRRELKIKGISEEIISASLGIFDTDQEKENAVRAARKAWNRCKPVMDARKVRQKIIISLVRKGYSWDDAKFACIRAEEEME